MPMNSYTLPRQKVTKVAARKLREHPLMPKPASIKVAEETWNWSCDPSHPVTKYQVSILPYIPGRPIEECVLFYGDTLIEACHACTQWLESGCRPQKEENEEVLTHV